MGADPFRVDYESMCPHLQGILKIKHLASDGFDIVGKIPTQPTPNIPQPPIPQIPQKPIQAPSNPVAIANKPSSLPQIPKELRFDA